VHRISQNKKDSGGISAFDPSLFFTIQRDVGMDPYIRGTAIGFAPGRDERAELLLCWANEGDPGWKRRLEYATERWNKRERGQILVFLG
jgi:hypothetical protein